MPQVLHWGWKEGTEHGFPSPLVSSDIQINTHSHKEGKSVLQSLQIQIPISFRNAFSDIARTTFSTGHIVNHWSWHIIFFLLLKSFFSHIVLLDYDFLSLFSSEFLATSPSIWIRFLSVSHLKVNRLLRDNNNKMKRNKNKKQKQKANTWFTFF